MAYSNERHTIPTPKSAFARLPAVARKKALNPKFAPGQPHLVQFQVELFQEDAVHAQGLHVILALALHVAQPQTLHFKYSSRLSAMACSRDSKTLVFS